MGTQAGARTGRKSPRRRTYPSPPSMTGVVLT
jgi:hypothetical protein